MPHASIRRGVSLLSNFLFVPLHFTGCLAGTALNLIERTGLGFSFLLRAGDIAETRDESETGKQQSFREFAHRVNAKRLGLRERVAKRLRFIYARSHNVLR